MQTRLNLKILILYTPFFFLPIIESYYRDLALGLLIIGSVFLSFYTLKRRSWDRIDTVWVIFLTAILISTVLSHSVGRSFLEFLRYALYFQVFLGVRKLNLEERQKIFQAVACSILVNSLLLSFLFIAASRFKIIFFPSLNAMNLYFSDFGHHPIAELLIITLPLCMYLFKISTSKIHKTLFIFLISFFLVILILSYSRAAYFIVFISLVLLTTHAGLQLGKLLKIMLPFYLVIFFIRIYIFLVSVGIAGPVPVNLPQQLYKPLISETRLNYVVESLKGFRDAPLFGNGPDSFRFVSMKYERAIFDWPVYAHNHILQLLSDTGSIGTFSFLILILLMIHKGIFQKKDKKDPIERTIIVIITALALDSIFEFNFQYISIFLYFWIFWGLILPKSAVQSVSDLKGDILRHLTILINIILILFSALHLKGTLGYYISLSKNDYPSAVTYALSVPWRSDLLDELSQYYLEKGDIGMSKQLNIISLQLEPENWYKNYLSIKINESTPDLTAYRKAIVMTILYNPKEAIEVHNLLEVLYRSYINEAKKSYQLKDPEKTSRIIKQITNIFPCAMTKNQVINYGEFIRQSEGEVDINTKCLSHVKEITHIVLTDN